MARILGGFQGDQGDQGDAGNLGNALVSIGIADRVDLPFVTETDERSEPAKRVRDQVRSVTAFGDRHWSAEKLAWAATAEFMTHLSNAASGADGNKTTSLLDDAIKEMNAIALVEKKKCFWELKLDDPHNITKSEIDNLVGYYINERPDAAGEIVDQADEFLSYFFAAMGASADSHPETYNLMVAVNRIATIIVMYLKKHYDRPRPSQVSPALLPPIPVPGHASFPSGHATQAHLFHLVFLQLFDKADDKDEVDTVLYALAARISRNREIAGLHYPTDTEAGRELANLLGKKLADLGDSESNSIISTIFNKSKAEWY